MLHKITPGADFVSIKPQKPRSRVYVMGTVMVSTARVRIDEDGEVSVLGEIIHEATEQVEPTSKVAGRMYAYDETMGEITAAAAYIVGETIYVSKEK